MSIAGVIAVDVSRSDATICLFCIRKRFRALSQFERRSIFLFFILLDGGVRSAVAKI